MSRATDETGDVPVSLEEARVARQTNDEIRHYFNNIRAWAESRARGVNCK